MGMTIEVDARGLNRATAVVLAELSDFIALALTVSAQLVAEQARRQHDYTDRTGDLTRSIEPHPAVGQLFAKNLESEVSADAGHAAFVELGTRAHRIEARRAKALRFVLGGRTVFAKSVQHPGTKARRFLLAALDAELGNIADQVLDGALGAFQQAGFGVVGR